MPLFLGIVAIGFGLGLILNGGEIELGPFKGRIDPPNDED